MALANASTRRHASPTPSPLLLRTTFKLASATATTDYEIFENALGATGDAGEPAPMVVSAEEERSQTTDREFIDAIRRGVAVSPTFEEGLRYMEFCEAVALSAHSGSAVRLPLAQPAMDSWGKRLG